MNQEVERVVWRGTPSQVVNFNLYTVCGLVACSVFPLSIVWSNFEAQFAQYKLIYVGITFALFIGPVFYAAWKWMVLSCNVYELTTERFKESSGVFSKLTEVLELYRVKDVTTFEPLSLRMFGCGNIIMETSDKSTPIVVLKAVKDVNGLQNLIRQNVEIMRKKKGVREFD